jgi:hypothetical protein
VFCPSCGATAWQAYRGAIAFALCNKCGHGYRAETLPRIEIEPPAEDSTLPEIKMEIRGLIESLKAPLGIETLRGVWEHLYDRGIITWQYRTAVAFVAPSSQKNFSCLMTTLRKIRQYARSVMC